MMRAMLPGAIAGEAWRNITSGTTKAALWAALFVATVGLIAFMDVRAVVAIVQGSAQFNAAGASVQVLAAPGRIDGQRCAALNGTGRIQQAGAIRKGIPITVLNMPGTPIAVVEATPGIIAMLPMIGQPTQTGTGGAGRVWLSADLAGVLGVTPGSAVHTSAGVATVTGVYTWPDDGRARDLGYAMITPVPPNGSFDQCWAHVWPADQDLADLTYMSLANSDGTQVAFRQLNTTLGATYDATTLFSDRLTARAPWAGAIIGLILGYAVTWARRLEIASALHARVPKTDLIRQHLVETLFWAACAGLITIAALPWAARAGNPNPDMATWLTGIRSVVAATAATPLGTVAAIATTREQHLFRYSRDR